jgi:hypothetical protein
LDPCVSKGSPTSIGDLTEDLRLTEASQTPVLALKSKAQTRAIRTNVTTRKTLERFGGPRPPSFAARRRAHGLSNNVVALWQREMREF